MKLAINAFNIRAGGGLMHLVELLSNVDPAEHGFSEVVVWARASTIDLLPSRPWLSKKPVCALERGWLRRLWWLYGKLPKELANMDLLFVPGGSYLGHFKPFVNMLQNVLPFDREAKSLYKHANRKLFLKWNVLCYVQAKTSSKAGGLIYPSHYAQRLINHYLSAPTRYQKVIYHGVNPQFRRDTPKKYRPNVHVNILYVSTVDMYKHQWDVVEAVCQLKRRGYNVSLDLIGDVGCKEALEKLQLTMQHYDPGHQIVTYHGKIDYDALPSFYKQADLFVFASSCESISSIIIEAMNAGLPIICANTSAMPEILGDAGCYYKSGDAQDLAVTIEKVLGSEAYYNLLSEKALAYSGEHLWSDCANETFSFLAEIAREYHES